MAFNRNNIPEFISGMSISNFVANFQYIMTSYTALCILFEVPTSKWSMVIDSKIFGYFVSAKVWLGLFSFDCIMLVFQ
jgi:hypothetical protein